MNTDDQLPPGWAWTTFGAVAIVASDLVDPKLTPNATHIAPNHIESWTGKLLEFTTVAIDGVESPKHRFQSGQILYSKIRPYLAKATLATFDGLCSADMYPVETSLETRYLLHWMLSHQFTAETSRNQTRTVLPKINQEALNRMGVPVAPLAEQRRIVAKIDDVFAELDAAVVELERVRANLKRYRASVLKAAVTGELTADWRAERRDLEPASALLARILTDRRAKWEADQRAKFAAAGKAPPKDWQAKYTEPPKPDTTTLPALPDGWCWATADQLIRSLRNGYFESPQDLPGGVKLLRINAVRSMCVSLEEYRYLPPSEALADYLICNDDLLFTRYNGSVDLLGVAGLVRGCTEPVVHPDKLIRVVAALPFPLPHFLEVACNTGASRKHMVSRARTSAGQTGISGSDIRVMPVPLPPLAEQEAIVMEVEARLSDVAAAEAAVATNLKRAARLRQSVLKEAFAGRLVPQDPADEPATALLDRLRAAKAKPAPTARGRKAKGAATTVHEAIVDFLGYTVPSELDAGRLNRTKIQKFASVLQAHCGVEIVDYFRQDRYGPHAPEISEMEAVCGQRGYFTTTENPKGAKGHEYEYTPGPNAEAGRAAGLKWLGVHAPAAAALLRTIRGMTTDEAELFATVHAVWNDLLIDGQVADEFAIVYGVYGWSTSKRKFTEATIVERIAWMRANGYTPTGRGRRTAVTVNAKPGRGRKPGVDRDRS